MELCLAGTGVPQPGADVYVHAGELADALRVCHRSLESTGHELIAAGHLTDVLRRVAAFGVTLARLDIRQDSTRHTAALAAITSPSSTRTPARRSRISLRSSSTTPLRPAVRSASKALT